MRHPIPANDILSYELCHLLWCNITEWLGFHLFREVVYCHYYEAMSIWYVRSDFPDHINSLCWERPRLWQPMQLRVRQVIQITICLIIMTSLYQLRVDSFYGRPVKALSHYLARQIQPIHVRPKYSGVYFLHCILSLIFLQTLQLNSICLSFVEFSLQTEKLRS